MGFVLLLMCCFVCFVCNSCFVDIVLFVAVVCGWGVVVVVFAFFLVLCVLLWLLLCVLLFLLTKFS